MALSSPSGSAFRRSSWSSLAVVQSGMIDRWSVESAGRHHRWARQRAEMTSPSQIMSVAAGHLFVRAVTQAAADAISLAADRPLRALRCAFSVLSRASFSPAPHQPTLPRAPCRRARDRTLMLVCSRDRDPDHARHRPVAAVRGLGVLPMVSRRSNSSSAPWSRRSRSGRASPAAARSGPFPCSPARC